MTYPAISSSAMETCHKSPLDANTEMEHSIFSFTEKVRQLQQQALTGRSESVHVLLMEAKEELHVLANTCLTKREEPLDVEDHYPTLAEIDKCGDVGRAGHYTLRERLYDEEMLRKAEEEALKSIPLQGLLGTCFQQEFNKDTRPSSGNLSSVSTTSSFGMHSSRTCSTPRSGYVSTTPTCPKVEFRGSTTTPRPTLPGFEAHDIATRDKIGTAHKQLDLRERSASPRPTIDCCLRGQEAVKEAIRLPRRPECRPKAAKGLCSPRNVLKEVESITDPDDDAWELEFLRLSRLD